MVGGIFTFGAPRIGNAESTAISARLYQGRCFRYMHAADMVRSLFSSRDYSLLIYVYNLGPLLQALPWPSLPFLIKHLESRRHFHSACG